MPPTMSVQIQVRFSQETRYGVYSDALYYSQEAYAALSEEQLQADIAARVAGWVAAIENPPLLPELTPEEEAAALLVGMEVEA